MKENDTIKKLLLNATRIVKLQETDNGGTYVEVLINRKHSPYVTGEKIGSTSLYFNRVEDPKMKIVRMTFQESPDDFLEVYNFVRMKAEKNQARLEKVRKSLKSGSKRRGHNIYYLAAHRRNMKKKGGHQKEVHEYLFPNFESFFEYVSDFKVSREVAREVWNKYMIDQKVDENPASRESLEKLCASFS